MTAALAGALMVAALGRVNTAAGEMSARMRFDDSFGHIP